MPIAIGRYWRSALVVFFNYGRGTSRIPLRSGLVRMLFPIAESLRDLIHRDSSTVRNLTSALDAEFEAVRPSCYKGKSATLALLYRHSLTHQDETRSVITTKRECRWRLSYDERADHPR